VFRITKGHVVSFVPPADIADILIGAGLEVEMVPLGRGRPHPHRLILGRRPRHSESA
jgi:hypothetical protein